MFCGRCGRAVNAATVPRESVADPRPGDTTILRPGSLGPHAGDAAHSSPLHGASPTAGPAPRAAAPSRSPSGGVPESDIPTGPIPPVPFVLSFSTGERVVVVGAGLLGRRPFVQPGERFDQLVSIADHERSVSKTHLEFGLESGDLWVCDRYSANGTVIIPPAGVPHRCEPGRRYRVSRGGRVELGDHWFDVR